MIDRNEGISLDFRLNAEDELGIGIHIKLENLKCGTKRTWLEWHCWHNTPVYQPLVELVLQIVSIGL